MKKHYGPDAKITDITTPITQAWFTAILLISVYVPEVKERAANYDKMQIEFDKLKLNMLH